MCVRRPRSRHRKIRQQEQHGQCVEGSIPPLLLGERCFHGGRQQVAETERLYRSLFNKCRAAQQHQQQWQHQSAEMTSRLNADKMNKRTVLINHVCWDRAYISGKYRQYRKWCSFCRDDIWDSKHKDGEDCRGLSGISRKDEISNAATKYSQRHLDRVESCALHCLTALSLVLGILEACQNISSNVVPSCSSSSSLAHHDRVTIPEERVEGVLGH